MNSFSLHIGDILAIAALCAAAFIPLGWRLHASRAKLLAMARLLLGRRAFRDLGTLSGILQGKDGGGR
ncbi:MAG: hypothetical protein PUI29_01415 [Aeromonadales bacterium]|nr:hypothetical protein [Aeromonadales bacterium]MDY2890561.1 hypothetical protein [Succinivibrio sp.]